jgi:hypothetical protein
MSEFPEWLEEQIGFQELSYEESRLIHELLEAVETWMDDISWELGVADVRENGVGGGAHET